MDRGNHALLHGADATDVVTALLDTRFGATRRAVAASPYALELADTVFRLCDDIIVDLQVRLQEDLVKISKCWKRRTNWHCGRM